jgi:pimeloyl-ACP methyl ester carboxylesterase
VIRTVNLTLDRRRFAEAIPGAQFQIHPGHGHFSILDAPVRSLATLAG